MKTILLKMDEERVVYKFDRYRRYHIMLSTEFETHSRQLFKLLLPAAAAAAVCVSFARQPELC